MRSILLLIIILGTISRFSFADIFVQPNLATEFPLGWSAGGIAGDTELPFYARASYGGFIPEYTDAMNGIAEGFGFYEESVSVLVSEGLNSANYWELGIGYAPSSSSGLYAEILYFYALGAGNVTGQELINAVSGINIASAGSKYSIESEVHSIRVTIGYRWRLEEQVVLSASGALIKPFDSVTSIDRPTSGPVQEALLEAADAAVDEYMRDLYENDIVIPVIGASLAYHF